MKFEFESFYKKKSSKTLGIVKIKIVDLKISLCGICFRRTKKGLVFKLPHYFIGKKKDPGDVHPVLHFEDQNCQKELMRFLKTEVKPEIKKILKLN